MKYPKVWMPLAFCVAFACITTAQATDYYVDNVGGNDANAGTSPSASWATFANINAHTFSPGDTINLKAGGTWNQELDLVGSGSASSPIIVTRYGSGNNPAISRNSAITDYCVKMVSSPSWWTLKNLDLSHAQFGVSVQYGNGVFGAQGLVFDGLNIHNMSDPTYPNWSVGLGFTGGNVLPSSSQYVLSNVLITGCGIGNVGAAIQFYQSDASGEGTPYSFQNLRIYYNYIHDCSGASSVGRDSLSVYFIGNYSYNLATSYLSQGTTGYFAWHCSNVYWMNNVFNGIPNTGSHDQTAIDMEAYCDTTLFYGNYVTNTAGPGFELLRLAGRSGDFNSNNYIASNAFVNTAYGIGGSVSGGQPTGAYWWNATSSGTTLLDPNYTGLTNYGGNLTPSSNIFHSAYQWQAYTQSGSWAYEYHNGSAWYVSGTFDAVRYVWTDGSDGQIGQFFLQPNSSGNRWVSYRWTAPTSGTIDVRSRIFVTGAQAGGVYCSITKNHGTTLWPSGSWGQNVSHAASVDASLDSIVVSAGDVRAAGRERVECIGRSPFLACPS